MKIKVPKELPKQEYMIIRCTCSDNSIVKREGNRLVCATCGAYNQFEIIIEKEV